MQSYFISYKIRPTLIKTRYDISYKNTYICRISTDKLSVLKNRTNYNLPDRILYVRYLIKVRIKINRPN